MCGSCIEYKDQELTLQPELCRCVDDNTIHVGEGLCGVCIFKVGPCLCSVLFFPFTFIVGTILGIFNWLTCGSCIPTIDTNVENLIDVKKKRYLRRYFYDGT